MACLFMTVFLFAGCAVHHDGVTLLKGRHIAYSVDGQSASPNSPAFVLVHGWASDRSVWAEQIDALSKSALVLAVDLPGHGASDPPADGYSMDAFAHAIAAVMDAANIKRAILVGHSNGVPAVRQFYRRYPQRTAGLILVDGALRSLLPAEVARPFLDTFANDDYAEKIGDLIDQMPHATLSDQQQDTLRNMAMRQRQDAVIGGLEASLDPAIWEEDPILAPTLMLNANSPFWTEDYKTFVHNLVPDLDYRTIEDVSHFLMIERPEEFNRAAIAFYERLTTRLRG